MSTSEQTTSTATGSFEIESWNEDVYADTADATLGRTRLTKAFHGDLAATGEVEMLAVSTPVEGGGEYQGAAYVAVERVTGSLHGRDGSFVLVHAASEPHGMKVAVVPGSASGQLRGLTGEISIARHADGSHSYTFAYALG